MAKLFPMHIRGPAPKGKKFFTFLDFTGSEKINRLDQKQIHYSSISYFCANHKKTV